MKKIRFLGILTCSILILILACQSFAATPTITGTTTISKAPKTTAAPTKKPTQIPADTQIEKIKDLVASRVAELKLVDKRGLLGYVKTTSGTQVIITDQKGEEIKVDIDELTKFESPDKKNDFGISDIKKDDLISFIGLFNKQTSRLLARFAEIASNIPQNIEAVVLSKDTGAFTLNIATDDGTQKVVNIETSTKTSIYQDGETSKSGFSKIIPGERVIIIGFADKQDKNNINAARIIHFPDLKLSEELKKAAAAGVKESKTTP